LGFGGASNPVLGVGAGIFFAFFSPVWARVGGRGVFSCSFSVFCFLFVIVVGVFSGRGGCGGALRLRARPFFILCV